MRIRTLIKHCAVSNLLVLSLALSSAVSGCNETSSDKKVAANDEGKAGSGNSATETNVAPVKCDVSADCPKGIDCVFPNGPDEPGFCDLKHMGLNGSDGGTDAGGDAAQGVHLGTPARCMTTDDCGDLPCIVPDGGDGVGFCDVSEMTQGGDGSGQVPPQMGTPAPCMTDDDCGPVIKCVFFNDTDTQGVCDVLEMSAP